MKNFLLRLLVALSLLQFSCKRNQDTPPSSGGNNQSDFATASVINQRLGRGINLGNTFEDQWKDPSYNPADFSRMADCGFSHVRIPIRWEAAGRAQYSSPYTISPSFLASVKSAVDLALKNKMHVIINMHNHDSLYAKPDALKPMFLAEWKQIAEYFKDYPDSLLFEVLNEPHGQLDPDTWNVFFADALHTIRESNPKRIVLVGTADWGGVSALNKLVLPADDRLILTVHYYNPFMFTHQGAEWVSGSDAWLGTHWYDTEFDRQDISEDFSLVIPFARDHNIPVHMGEFGAYSKGDMDSRVRWTRYLARWFEQQKFSWAYWEFNSGFGIYDPVSGQYRTALRDALTHDAMTPPTPVTLTGLYSSNFANPQNDGWNLYNNDPSASSSLGVANNRATVTISKEGTESWYIQLIKGGTSLVAGKTYRIVFRAYSTGSRSLSATMMLATAPWTVYGNKDFTISAADTEYSFVFTAANSDANANFLFSMGKGGLLPVTLYDIRLQELTF